MQLPPKMRGSREQRHPHCRRNRHPFDQGIRRHSSAKTRVWIPGQEVIPGLRGALNVVIAHMNGIYPGDDHIRVRDLIEKNGGTCPLLPGEEYPPKLILPKPTGADIPMDIRMFMLDDICLFIPEGHYFTGTE